MNISDLIDNKILPLDFVSALSGDTKLTPEQERLYSELKNCRGKQLYSDLIFSVTHQHFTPDIAFELWNNILKHKYETSTQLKRNIGISVATLDYLYNIRNQIKAPILITETDIASIMEIAVKDGLTQLFGYTVFYNRLQKEIDRFFQTKTPCSIIFMDIDNFKKINDEFGHLEGDKVLFQIARIVQQLTRQQDICARYGGEEFAIILTNTPLEQAYNIAERIRTYIEKFFTSADNTKITERMNNTSFPIHTPMTVTVSQGVTTCRKETKTATDMVMIADKALHQAKVNGKNKIFLG